MAINNNGYIDYHKDLGLAHEVLDKDVLNRLRKYSIAMLGLKSSRDYHCKSEPLVVGYKQGALALAYDGSLVNFVELRERMEDNGVIFQLPLIQK